MSNSALSGNNTASLDETKIIYHIDEEETPYLIKINAAPDKVTLGDFRNALNRPHYKYFFKSMDDDFGVVKEEISDDNARLPCFNGRVISWLVTAEGSTVSDGFEATNEANGTKERTIESRHESHNISSTTTTSSSKSNHNHHPSALSSSATTTATSTLTASNNIHLNKSHNNNNNNNSTTTNGESDTVCDTCTDTDSIYSAAQDRIGPLRSFHDYKHAGRMSSSNNHHKWPANTNSNNNGPNPIYETNSSMVSSDLDSTSFFDSEEESSRFSTTTGTTLSSRYGRQRQQRRRRRPPAISRASSFSSITDSTMSLNIITVRLNMDTVKFLGISIVGQSNKGGDGGIYVGSIMKGGAVAQDGRIEPGDMILEVNDISFEDMSNDDAVKTLREEVQKAGPITLVVAKCWDPNPKGYFTIPRQEPVRPIDPRAWVLHTNAMTTGGVTPGGGGVAAPSMQSLLSGGTMLAGTSAATFNAGAGVPTGGYVPPGSGPPPPPPPPNGGWPHNYHPAAVAGITQGHHGPGSIVTTTSSSLPESERYQDDLHLTVNTDIGIVVRVMSQPDSGLDIRDRLWLKITLPNAFIGSDLVDWLYRHVEGFNDRKEARKYASTLLKFGYIRHTVNKVTFSEQCYYVLGDGIGISRLSLDHVDSVSEAGGLNAHHSNPHHHLSHYPHQIMPPSNSSYGPPAIHQQLAALPPPNWTTLTQQSTELSTTTAQQPLNNNTSGPLQPTSNNSITPTTTATASSNSQYSVVGPPPPYTNQQHLLVPNNNSTTSNNNSNFQQQSQNIANSCPSLSSTSSSSTSSSSSYNKNNKISTQNNTNNHPPKPPPRTTNNPLDPTIKTTCSSSLINTSAVIAPLSSVSSLKLIGQSMSLNSATTTTNPVTTTTTS